MQACGKAVCKTAATNATPNHRASLGHKTIFLSTCNRPQIPSWVQCVIRTAATPVLCTWHIVEVALDLGAGSVEHGHVNHQLGPVPSVGPGNCQWQNLFVGQKLDLHPISISRSEPFCPGQASSPPCPGSTTAQVVSKCVQKPASQNCHWSGSLQLDIFDIPDPCYVSAW